MRQRIETEKQTERPRVTVELADAAAYPRIVIFGNSGSGKTTLARLLSDEHDLPHLDLDRLAWDEAAVRRDLQASTRDIERFVATNIGWVVEGCYGDLLERVMPHASEAVFLNPGIEACVANCRARPWEPDKYPSKAEQDARLDFLIQWVREYETRDDEFSLARHRALYESFEGPKREITRRG